MSDGRSSSAAAFAKPSGSGTPVDIQPRDREGRAGLVLREQAFLAKAQLEVPVRQRPALLELAVLPLQQQHGAGDQRRLARREGGALARLDPLPPNLCSVPAPEILDRDPTALDVKATVAGRGARIGEPNVGVRPATDGDGPPLRQVVDRDGVSFDGHELQPVLGPDTVVRERLSNSHQTVSCEIHTAGVESGATEGTRIRLSFGGARLRQTV